VSDLFSQAGHIFFVSAASTFELATKHRIGKLPGAEVLLENFEEQVENAGFQVLSITSLHARVAGTYPHSHKDPFDRLLAAQSSIEQLTLLSADAQLDAFNIKRLW
jgi:PIN domain nuclease of toxin-antitoxin system